jgi:hypothetical protein
LTLFILTLLALQRYTFLLSIMLVFRDYSPNEASKVRF